MAQRKTLGGDRLGSGNKMKVTLHGYERSTHDLGYLWRSTMSPGTLVPFMVEVALPGDTFDINLNADGKTHPTIGPLFGSYKMQLDTFFCPIRLYHSALHNNKIGIGMKMQTVILPTFEMTALVPPANIQDLDNSQVNPSSLLSYLGIRGIGWNNSALPATREFNAIPLLAYWEIYKNYYSNKMEEIGAVLHTVNTVTQTIDVNGFTYGGVPLQPLPTTNYMSIVLSQAFDIQWTGTEPDWTQVIVNLAGAGPVPIDQLRAGDYDRSNPNHIVFYPADRYQDDTLVSWTYSDASTLRSNPPTVVTFPLSNIDDMRTKILAKLPTLKFDLNADGNIAPYQYIWQQANSIPNVLSSQEGLALKTFQSDLFNNWLQTDWIDGVGGINDITAVDTSSGSFKIDALNLAKKVYDVMNRIAVSGGTYDDWLDVVYDHERFTRPESPVYMGGLSKELVFQEVVSNSQTPTQPLGSLAGKGIMSKKHKGGHVIIKVDEPGYIIGLVSLTPRLDYSQGNKWDTYALKTMDDFHKPGMDEIGFQELITEQMAWWSTYWNGTDWIQKSAGKQPAWLNYMTNVNQARGNFAVGNSNEIVGEMFMTLNRRYQADTVVSNGIKDLTTYIDPVKFNQIFAETAIDAQNFWVQIAVDITARRKMSARLIPNL